MKMAEPPSPSSHMIPAVQLRTESYGKRKPPFSCPKMWEVSILRKVGPQEKKGVFLSFMLDSSYESGLALGNTLIAGGLQGTWRLGKHARPNVLHSNLEDTDGQNFFLMKFNMTKYLTISSNEGLNVNKSELVVISSKLLLLKVCKVMREAECRLLVHDIIFSAISKPCK